MRQTLTFALLCIAAGCGDDAPDEDSPVDGAVADTAAPDAAIDAVPADAGDDPRLGGDITGRWRALPNLTRDDVPEEHDRWTLTYLADGTMTAGQADDDTPNMGTWTIDGGHVVMTFAGENGGGVSSVPFVATADRLVMEALVPVGVAVGPVGTWTGVQYANGAPTTITIGLAADQTATIAIDRATGTDLDTAGVWRAVGDDLDVSYMPSPNSTVHVRTQLAAGALGSAFERLP